jgi:hypothetical protein
MDAGCVGGLGGYEDGDRRCWGEKSEGELLRKLRPTPGCNTKEEEYMSFIFGYNFYQFSIYNTPSHCFTPHLHSWKSGHKSKRHT